MVIFSVFNTKGENKERDLVFKFLFLGLELPFGDGHL
jgi:hypothetical protein